MTDTKLAYTVRNQGAVRVIAIWILHRGPESILLSVDCAQKRPDYVADYDDGILEITLYKEGIVTDPTLIDVCGVPGAGGWRWVLHEWGKWGPRIALLGEQPGQLMEETSRSPATDGGAQ